MKIRSGDTVVVIAGKDKGKVGKILRVLHGEERVVIGGVNMRTKHIRRTSQQPGQRIRYEASVHASTVMFVDPTTKKRTRIGYRFDEKGRKQRIAKRSGEVVGLGRKTEGHDVSQGGPSLPPKVPFWKKLGIGGGALKEGERAPGEVTQEERSVPEESRLDSSRSHSRGS